MKRAGALGLVVFLGLAALVGLVSVLEHERQTPEVVSPVDERPRSVLATEPLPAPGPPVTEGGMPDPGIGRSELAVDDAVGLARLHGSVTDSAGAPVGDARVRAGTLERRDGQPRFSQETRTDPAGAFVLELEVGAEAAARAGQEYLLDATHPEYRPATSATPALRPGLTIRRNLVLRERVETLVELEVLVRDDAGPVGGAVVELFEGARVLPGGDAEARRALEGSAREASRTTPSDGRVVLGTDRLGDKLILVSAQREGHQTNLTEIHLAQAGRASHTVWLRGGLEIAGLVRSVAGERYDGLQLELDPEALWPLEGSAMRTKPGGVFRASGLSPGAHTVEGPLSDPRWSPFRTEVFAGDLDLELVIKEREDPRDHGLHLGEIHGTLPPFSLDAIDSAQSVRIVEVTGIGRAELRADVLPDLYASEGVTSRIVSVAVHMSSNGEESLLIHGEDVTYSRGDHGLDFHFVGLEDGDYVIVGSDPEQGAAHAGPIAIRGHSLVNDVQLAFAEPASLAGRVVDPEGRPVADARVFVAGEGPRTRERLAAVARGELRNVVVTDADGHFELARAPVDLPVRLHATHADWKPTHTDTLRLDPGGQATGVQVVFVRRDVW